MTSFFPPIPQTFGSSVDNSAAISAMETIVETGAGPNGELRNLPLRGENKKKSKGKRKTTRKGKKNGLTEDGSLYDGDVGSRAQEKKQPLADLGAKLQELKEKEEALAKLQVETESLRKSVETDIEDYCKSNRLELAKSLFTRLPRELREMIYDTFLHDFISAINLSKGDYLYYREAKFRDVLHYDQIWDNPCTLIFRPEWVGRAVAKEAAGYAYSKIPLSLSWATQTKHFLMLPCDIFRLGLDPKQHIRSLKIWLDYNHRSKDGWHSTGAYYVYGDTDIRALRDEQIRCLELLLKIPRAEGFKLRLTINTRAYDTSSQLESLNMLEDLGPLIFKLKGEGFRVEMSKVYLVDRNEKFEGWMDGGLEGWERRVREKRDNLEKITTPE